MIRTVNPYDTARTAEIMSRYRPIAPKPEAGQANSNGSDSPDVPRSMRRTPYLRNVWNHLQARPTRTRKRGRSSFPPPAQAMKRVRTCLQGLSIPYQVTNLPAKNLAILGFSHNPNGIPQIPLVPILVPLKCELDSTVTTPAESVALPVLGCTTAQNPQGKKPEIDLNLAVEESEEFDFMPQLKEPVNPVVITPRAVRPIGSTVSVKRISENSGQRATATGKQVLKNPAEVEEEVEAEEMPAVVSDSNNKVRLTNSAYMEMVGQPECCWLDFVPSHDGGGGGGGGGACKRIGGEVALRLEDSSFSLSSNGFNCWVTIEWATNGKRSCVNAFCEAMKLGCEAKDYQFLWRFHKSEDSKSGSNI